MSIHQRKFLASTSHIVIVAKLPPPRPPPGKITKTDFVPIGDPEKIEDAFDLLKSLMFGLRAQTSMFGIWPDCIASSDELRREVEKMAHCYKSRDVWQRINCLSEIRTLFIVKVGTTPSDHLFWLATEPRDKNFKFREKMEQGALTELLTLRAYLSLWDDYA